MMTIGTWLEHPYAQALAWALMHFVWQGAAIGIATWLILRFVRLSSASRYAIGVAALALMLAAPMATMAIVWPDRSPFAASPQANDLGATSADATASSANLAVGSPQAVKPTKTTGPFESFVLALWLTGVVVLSCRLVGGWLLARRYATRGLRPVSDEIDQIARRVAERLGLARLVRLFESSSVAVPVTIGWIKPVVLLPMTAMSGLSTAQVEALLAHELAHIRRHDYLVNLLQSAMETLLFYHPAVWWVSKRVRAEREHCCDDLAVAICDRVVYVRALTDLASIATPRLALAATDGSLVRRVRRLLGEPGSDRDLGTGWLSAMLAVLIVGGAVPVAVGAVIGGDKPTQAVEKPGVGQGVPGGVAGGVPGGVAGGVPGGVGRGVPGGVSEEAAAVADERQDPEERARALRQVLAAERESQRRLQELRTNLEQQRLSIELHRMMAEREAERGWLVAQLDDLRARQERAKRLAEKGLIGSDAADELQVQMRLVERKLQAVGEAERLDQREIELKTAQLQLLREAESRKIEIERDRHTSTAAAQQRVAELMVHYSEAQQKYNALLALGQRAQTDEARAARDNLLRLEKELETLRRVLGEVQSVREPADVEQIRHLRELAIAVERLSRESDADQTSLRSALQDRQKQVAEAAGNVAANDTARAGDILMIQMHNEPDLPIIYVVQENGSIRLPLIGPIKVLGLTAPQIQEEVRKQFNDRKLASGSSAEVTLRRPRRE